MILAGLQKLSLLDFPERVACTVFTGGCDFRCPFCHNSELLSIPLPNDLTLTEEDFFAFLKKRKHVLDGVCITGGEPTLQKDLGDMIKKIKDMGFLVKLDTNGDNPVRLRQLIDEKLIDYAAMDIKNSPEKYPMTIGLAAYDMGNIRESAALLMEKRIPFEFRTTVVHELHTEDDIEKISLWLKGNEPYFLQAFVMSDAVPQKALTAPDAGTMAKFLSVAKKNIPNASLRGL